MTSLSKTYYVSSQTGNDSTDGLTSESAFASLFAINHRSESLDGAIACKVDSRN